MRRRRRGGTLLGGTAALSLLGACSLLFDAGSLSSGGAAGPDGGDGSVGSGDDGSTGDDGGGGGDGGVDTSNDPKNCGVAGHDCLGGACASGHCQPIALATGQAHPAGIFLGADSVYWTNLGRTDAGAPTPGNSDGALRRVAKSGGALTTLWADPNYRGPSSVAVDEAANVAYVAVNVTGVVGRVSLDGGAFVELATGQGSPSWLLLDALEPAIYWSNGFDTAVVHKLTLPSGAARTLARGGAFNGQLQLDATRVYWANGTDHAVSAVPRDGCVTDAGCPAVLVPDAGNGAGALALDPGATVVYWTTTNDGQVWRSGLDGSGVQLLASGLRGVRGIAADADWLYVTVKDLLDPNGTVRRVAKDGSKPPEVLASGQLWPGTIAVDATAIYWTNIGSLTAGLGEFDVADGSVMKLAK